MNDIRIPHTQLPNVLAYPNGHRTADTHTISAHETTNEWGGKDYGFQTHVSLNGAALMTHAEATELAHALLALTTTTDQGENK